MKDKVIKTAVGEFAPAIDRTKGILAAMKYLGKHLHDHEFKYDSNGAVLLHHRWEDLDINYGCYSSIEVARIERFK